MTRGRLEASGDELAWLLCGVQRAVWGGEVLDFERLNPYRDPPPLSPALEAYYAGRAKARLRNLGRPQGE